MDGFGDMFAQVFNFLIGCFIVAVLGVIYFFYTLIFSKEEVVTEKKIVPEMKLIIKDNKVDTLWIYKQQK
jgi:hypothetical protein